MATERLPDALRSVLSLDRADLHTVLPASVVDYDEDTQTATLELGIREVIEAHDEDDADAVATYPRLRGVPVAFMSAGPWVLSFPIPAGTTGALICTEADLSKWLETGQVSDPGVNDRHGLGGFFLPGLRHSRNRIDRTGQAGALALGKEGGIVLTIGDAAAAISGPTEIEGTIKVNGESDAAALASLVAIELGEISTAITGLGGSYTPALGGVASQNIKTGG
jgi:hypothetical protein